ncbi:MAG: RnfH family protein [Pseudomonadota bacterium]
MNNEKTSSPILIEVAYALPDKQTLLALQVPEGTRVAEAIHLSGILDKHPEIDTQVNKVGIFSKLAKLDTELRDKDRVEIYRPLIADPKEARRKRAEKAKIEKKLNKGT